MLTAQLSDPHPQSATKAERNNGLGWLPAQWVG